MKYIAINRLKTIRFFSFSLLFSFGVNAEVTLYPNVENLENGIENRTIFGFNETISEHGFSLATIKNYAASGTYSTGNYSVDLIIESVGLNKIIGQSNVVFQLASFSDYGVQNAVIVIEQFNVYEDCTLNIDNNAQDAFFEYDGLGNQADVDDWLNNHGGATTSSTCDSLTWTYEGTSTTDPIVNENNNAIEWEVTFIVTNEFGASVSTIATLTISGIKHFNPDFFGQYGTGDTICEDTYNLNDVITDLDPESSLYSPNITFQFSSIPPGASIGGSVVDFPDTGAGSYSYNFTVDVTNSVTVYRPSTNDFTTTDIQEQASISINDKTVAFQTEELGAITVCPGEISTIQDLTDRLVIYPDPNVLPPQDPSINLNQYWSPSEYNGPGTYTFDPRDAFPNCPSNFISVTVSEEEELLAGISYVEVADNIECGNVAVNLNNYLDSSADAGGNWYKNEELVVDGIDFPDTGAGQYSIAYVYRQEDNGCGFFSEADYEIIYDVAGLSTGSTTSIEICSGVSITEQNLLNALQADIGGTWNPAINPTNVAAGIYVYSHGACGIDGDSTIEVIQNSIIFSVEAQNESSIFYNSWSQPANLDLAAFNNWLNSNGGAVALSDCGDIIWSYSYEVSYSASEDTVTYVTTFVANDGTDSVNTIATFTFNNVFVNAGGDFIFQSESGIDGGTRCGNDDFNLAIIEGFYVQYDASATFEFTQTEGPPGTSFIGSVVDFPDTGAGQFLYSFDFRRDLEVDFPDLNLQLSDEAIVTFWVVVPFDVGEDGTLVVCEGQEVTLEDLYNSLEGTPEFEGSAFALSDLWTPAEYQGPGDYIFDFSKVAPECNFSSATVTVTETSECFNDLNLKVFLQGAFFNPNVGEESLMRDNLRSGSFLPTTSPYSDGKTCNSSVFGLGGTSGIGALEDDIVDWIFVELRDKNNAATLLYGRSALLQRDGDVVEIDGVSDLSVVIPYDDYFIAVKHRNHLGIMSNSVISLHGSTTLVDFTNSGTPIFGNNSRVLLDNGSMALWAGDVNGDGQVRYLGPNNDTNVLKNIVVNEPGNNANSNFYPFTGYHSSDINMDGQIRYLGPGNDTNILKSIVLGHPSNGTVSNFFPFSSQVPNQP